MKEGECIGVIGLNGAGKSTLSNIISEQIAPTTGQIDINGEVSIIAAGAGMQNNISGRENIRLKGLMLGMKNKEIKAKMQEIIDFSELGPFIDQPVKTYSSGMRAKLGFSIMVHQDPDIMIIDEGLSVGDKTFVDKAQKKMFEFRDKGKTILLVSHDMRTIKEWCDRVIWLNHGEVKAYGRTDEVLPEYEKFVNWFKALPKKEQEYYKKEQRQAQFDYSVEELKKEIVSQSTIRSRRIHQEVNQVLKQKKR
nr:ABC transporter ATP-binding protein [Lactococcus petauri]